MNPELYGHTSWDEAWRSLEIRASVEVTESDRDLEPGVAVIIPGIPQERQSELHVMVEQHKLCIRWHWGPLARGAEKPPADER